MTKTQAIDHFCFVERSLLLRGVHGGDPAFLHYNGQAHDTQDANANRRRVCL